MPPSEPRTRLQRADPAPARSRLSLAPWVIKAPFGQFTERFGSKRAGARYLSYRVIRKALGHEWLSGST